MQMDKEAFEAALAGGQPLVVDFWAEWCMPCRMLAPVVEQLAQAYAGRITVAKINVDEEPELAQQYGVQSIPCLLYFKNGQPVGELVGVRPYEQLAAAADKLLA